MNNRVSMNYNMTPHKQQMFENNTPTFQTLKYNKDHFKEFVSKIKEKEIITDTCN